MGEIHGWSDEQKNEEIDMDYGPRYCDKCEFEAADGYELEGHIWSEHDEEAANCLPILWSKFFFFERFNDPQENRT